MPSAFPNAKVQPHSVRIVGAERIGTHELGKAARLVGISTDLRAHLVQHNGNSRLRYLPGRLGPRHSSPDNVYGFHHAAANSTP
jgi:hypothetical protein